MKKLLSACTGLMFLMISCTSSETKVSSKQQANLDASNAVVKAIQTGDVSSLDKVLAADAIDHAGMTGDVNGRDSIKAMLAKIHEWADINMEVIKELADDEYVFQWIRFKGTAKTSDMGLAPGTAFDMTAIEVSKFKDGLITEHWEFMQPADMMKMMQQPTVPAPAVDTLLNK